MLLFPLDLTLLVMDHLRERERVRFLITRKAYRGVLETRTQKARATFDAVKGRGFLDNGGWVNFPITLTSTSMRYIHFDGIHQSYRTELVHSCIEIKVGLETNGLICIRTIRGSVAENGNYTLRFSAIRHFAPWKGTLIYSNGREECAKRVVVCDAALEALIAAC